MSIQKAISANEVPVKEKHVRSILLKLCHSYNMMSKSSSGFSEIVGFQVKVGMKQGCLTFPD
jgi:hypothetical protein